MAHDRQRVPRRRLSTNSSPASVAKQEIRKRKIKQTPSQGIEATRNAKAVLLAQTEVCVHEQRQFGGDARCLPRAASGGGGGERGTSANSARVWRGLSWRPLRSCLTRRATNHTARSQSGNERRETPERFRSCGNFRLERAAHKREHCGSCAIVAGSCSNPGETRAPPPRRDFQVKNGICLHT